MIKVMFPVACLASALLLNRISLKNKTKDAFQQAILLYMIGKLTMSVICALSVQIFFSKDPQVEEAIRMHQESIKIGICKQLKMLFTDKIYLLFVYGPLLSMTMVSASDNHLYSLFKTFSITYVGSP
jgi:hypothetical protein